MSTATFATPLPPLIWLRLRLGSACQEMAVDEHRPLLLDDGRHGYLTLADHHDLESVGYRQGHPVGESRPVASCPAGQLLLGTPPASTPGPMARVLRLRGAPGSAVWRVPLDALARVCEGDGAALEMVSLLLDAWFGLLIESLPATPVPLGTRAVAPGQIFEPVSGLVRAGGGLCWIAPSLTPTGYRGIPVGQLEVPALWWAVTPDTAADCTGSGFRVASTASLLAADPRGTFMRGFAAFMVGVVGQGAAAAPLRSSSGCG